MATGPKGGGNYNDNIDNITRALSMSNDKNINLLQKVVEQQKQNKENKALNDLAGNYRKQLLLLEQQIKVIQESNDISEAEKEELVNAINNQSKEIKEQKKSQNVEGLTNTLKQLASSFLSSIDNNLSTYNQYLLPVSSALKGTGETYEKLNQRLIGALGSSASVSLTDVLSNVGSLASAGLVSNVEQRAYLQTLSKGIAEHFSASDATLTRIERLQQEESVANRLALEASLQEFLNQNFENSQYLVSSFDSVTGNLVEAVSLLTGSAGLGLEATVQKWTGSLSSVGMSDSAISGISQALGWLGSGNLTQLSNSGFGTLLALASSRQGLSYTDLLENGLTASSADTLMSGVVSYLASLYSGSSSNVVKSAYGNIFGLGVSDLKAAYNLSNKGTSGTIGYGADTLGGYLKEYDGYINAGIWLDNAKSNVLYSTAAGIANSDALYGVWEAGKILSSIGSSFGQTTVGKGLTITGMGLQLGTGLISLIGGSIGNAAEGISGMWSNAGLNALNSFNALGGKSVGGGNVSGAIGKEGTKVKVNGGSGGTGGNSPDDTDNTDYTERGINDIYDLLKTETITVAPQSTGIWTLDKLSSIDLNTKNIYDLLASIIVDGGISINASSLGTISFGVNDGVIL